MGKVKFQESTIDLKHDRHGKIAVFFYEGSDDPRGALDQAVSKYVQHDSFSQFVEISRNNPWVRVVILGMNEMDQKDFDLKTAV